MAVAPEEPTSPVLANIVVLVGFAVLFTTFVTDSPWSWIIGGLMVLAGGLWAGFATSGTAEGLPHAATPAPEVSPPPAAAQVEDGTEGAEVVHGPGTGRRSDGHRR